MSLSGGESMLYEEIDRVVRELLHLGGFVFFVFVTGFILAVTAWLGEVRLFLSSLALVLLFLVVSWRVLSRGDLLRPTVP